VLWPAVLAVLLAGILVSAGGSSAALRFALVFRVAKPYGNQLRAVALARSFRFDRPTIRTTLSGFVVTDHAETRELVVYKASADFDYVNRAYYRQLPSGPLLTLKHARRTVTPFLRAHGLLPAGSFRIALRREYRTTGGVRTPDAIVVTVTPLPGGTPVRDGAITFWLGARGLLLRLRYEYRSLAPAPLRVALRPKAAELAEINDDLGTTADVRLRLVYVAAPPYLEQPYLEPAYEAVVRGFVLDRVRATTFTPRATIRAPDPSVPIAAGSTVNLRAAATEGRRPYSFTWSANRTGLLGKGKALDVPLSADDTEVQLTVRDSSGAGMTYTMPVWVYGPSTVAPGGPNRGPLQVPGLYGDGSVSFTADQDRTHPLYFRHVEFGGFERTSDVYFDQFRYSVLVRYLGKDYHITSQKCVPLTVAGDACTLPMSPYAQSAGASAPTGGGSGAWVYSGLAVDNLPGKVTLVVEGSAQTAYCGPSGELGAVLLGMQSKFVYGTTGGRLGSDCPGFRPSVQWSYKPPATFKPSDFARLCLQGAKLCDVPHNVLVDWATGDLDNGPQPEITDFQLSVYTAVNSNSADPERAALAKDTDSPLKLAATDGPVDTSCRPWHSAKGALGTLGSTDAFACIAPIQTERSAVLATPSGRGDWDSLDLKSENPGPYGISFPNCNQPLNSLDIPGCIHLNEHWLGQTPGSTAAYSRGQEVVVYVVRSNPGEASPSSVESLVNGEPLRQDAEHGSDLVFWHRSTASSTQCYPSGGVDNTDRPCLVFPQAMFFTPR
jgi:hypothetical protein